MSLPTGIYCVGLDHYIADYLHSCIRDVCLPPRLKLVASRHLFDPLPSDMGYGGVGQHILYLIPFLVQLGKFGRVLVILSRLRKTATWRMRLKRSYYIEPIAQPD